MKRALWSPGTAMSTEHIIFVDDEPLVLKGIRRALYHRRNEWTLEFAVNADDALKQLETFPATVVVADMRMPGRDGAELLDEVRRRHPAVIRFILSGDSSVDAIMRAAGSSHQYLSKPCECRALEQAIDRTRRVRELVENPALARKVAGLTHVPSLPDTYKRLREALQSSDVRLDAVAGIIQCDVAMCAQVLKLVNSAYFGLPRRVTEIDKAVSYLGLDTITSLALGYGAFDSLNSGESDSEALRAVSDSALRSAGFARAIARAENVEKMTANDACLAAMLGHLGEILAITQLPTEYRAVTEHARHIKHASDDIELEVGGYRFDELGAYLIGLWSLPDAVVEAVAFRKRPSRSAVHTAGALAITHLAYCLERVPFGTKVDMLAAARQLADAEFLSGIELSHDWDHWWDVCYQDAEEAA